MVRRSLVLRRRVITNGREDAGSSEYHYEMMIASHHQRSRTMLTKPKLFVRHRLIPRTCSNELKKGRKKETQTLLHLIFSCLAVNIGGSWTGLAEILENIGKNNRILSIKHKASMTQHHPSCQHIQGTSPFTLHPHNPAGLFSSCLYTSDILPSFW